MIYRGWPLFNWLNGKECNNIISWLVNISIYLKPSSNTILHTVLYFAFELFEIINYIFKAKRKFITFYLIVNFI